MLWFFEREGRRTTIEVLHLPTGDYELRIENPDGVERVEHFKSADDLAKRQHALQETFARDPRRAGTAGNWPRSKGGRMSDEQAERSTRSPTHKRALRYFATSQT